MTRRYPCCRHCLHCYGARPLNGHPDPCDAEWCDQGKRHYPEPQLGSEAA